MQMMETMGMWKSERAPVTLPTGKRVRRQSVYRRRSVARALKELDDEVRVTALVPRRGSGPVRAELWTPEDGSGACMSYVFLSCWVVSHLCGSHL